LVLGFVLSDEPFAPKARQLLIWMLSALMFSPLYLLIAFTMNTPSLLAILLIAFTCAIGLAISDVQKKLIHGETAVPAVNP